MEVTQKAYLYVYKQLEWKKSSGLGKGEILVKSLETNSLKFRNKEIDSVDSNENMKTVLRK